ncbi:WbqC family protein [Dysgonomonas sp. Marseille-P4677]|uniref:WbqC family protein n=1 Tax=Dysgonomonas sp. Marseille-P4677 TaxID=2364790 RepID=UPI001912A015|nr:WbqC family protein [Dysgonomonas sp. Marseille-P4677]MBK5721760.1 WbqC family protein [Dysgonomonas sp. Marseille-P4677]
MKIGIMQPYFLPYIGYFQLLNAVDKYVIYDNIQYTKKGWINRNRILQNGKDLLITVPVEKDSDYLDIKDRFVSNGFERKKLLNQIRESYRKAPYFNNVMPLIENIINYKENNLFLYIHNSVLNMCEYLNIKTEIIVSSTLNIDHSLKGQDKVIAICKELNATDYYNAIGGQELYNTEDFGKENISLHFLSTNSIEYKQLKNEFIPWLSILDVVMFNSCNEINDMLNEYKLIN